MNSVERVKALCKERHIAISKLERDLGYANGYIGQLVMVLYFALSFRSTGELIYLYHRRSLF